jgi:S-DNA-T family DNA segregation ATPase FtsK/SpoIIIE
VDDRDLWTETAAPMARSGRISGMRVLLTVVDPRGSASAVEVAIEAPPGTALGTVRAGLLGAVGRQDGLLYAGESRLSDDDTLGEPPLLEGTVLTVDRPGRAEPRGLLELHVVAGPDSGAVHRLPPGEHGIGRSVEARVRIDDPDVSRLHAVLRVASDGSGTTVHDLASTNGTTVDDLPVRGDSRPLLPGSLLRVGGTRLRLAVPEVVPVSCRPDGAGHLEVNRPPRHVRPAVPVRLTMPTEPPARERGRFPLIAILLPLVAGVALVAITRSPTYLLFVLLSPLMALGTFWSDRAGGRKSARAQAAAHADALDRVAHAVTRAVDDEATARHTAHPGPAVLALTVSGPRPRLWERRPLDDDALELRLGLGAITSTVEVRTPGALGTGGVDEVERPPIGDAPVTVPLAEAGVLGLAGPRDRVLPVARSLVAQLAGWHSPRHLRLVLLSATSGPEWEWARWLPHLQDAAGSARLQVAVEATQLRSRVDELLALLERRLDARAPGVDRASTGPTVVVLLDGAAALRRQPGVARLLAEGPAVGIRAICVEGDRVALPVECRATAEATGPVGTGLRIVGPDSTTYDDVVADGVSERWARRFARAMAPLRDATPTDRQSALPSSIRFLDLVPFDATDPAALEMAWRVSPRDTRVPLGVGTCGEPFVVDLAADGPHVLVAGTTGAGKSELLQTLVAGLAVGNRPDEMSFVLIDYKGGAAFRECAELPHTVGMVTDLDGHLTERALRSLGAELRRREALLAGAGCTDAGEYVACASPTGEPLPRLVLVVDEFATLAEELPDFVGGLVAIAQRGRSLGVHLVLATQRPGGVVSADIRANTSLRIALRVTDASESTDVIDARDAADIAPDLPGRAVLRVGAGAVRALQTARVSGQAAESSPVSVRPVPWEQVGNAPAVVEAQVAAGPTDLIRLVRACRAAADALGSPRVDSPWLPPLPDLVTVDDLAGLRVPPGGVPLGLADLPSEQRRGAVTFDLDAGDHLLVVGSPRSGRTTMLHTLAAGLAERFAVTDLHLYGLDGAGGGLAAVAALPHCGAVVGREETSRGEQLLARLAGELERRQRLLAHGGAGTHQEQRRTAPIDERLPWMVLLVDGWEGLVTAYESVDHGRPLDTLLRLVREGAAVGLRVVMTGDRAVLTSRAGSAIRDRLVLRLADPADNALAGISPPQVPGEMPAGRALVWPAVQEAQLAVLDAAATSATAGRALGAVAAAARARQAEVTSRDGLLPLRVEPLPVRVDVDDVEAAAKAASTGPGWALVGVGGDELLPCGVDLDIDGPAFVIAGPAGSGRSTALATMGRWLLGQGRRAAVIAHRRSPLRTLGDHPGVLAVLGSDDPGALEEHLAAHPDLVVLADDAETLHDTAVERPLLARLRADADGGAVLLLAGSAAEMSACFRGLTVEARRARTGLLLGAMAPADGDLLGVRLPRTDAAPPGRGVLVVRGRVTPVQVATTSL